MKLGNSLKKVPIFKRKTDSALLPVFLFGGFHAGECAERRKRLKGTTVAIYRQQWLIWLPANQHKGQYRYLQICPSFQTWRPSFSALQLDEQFINQKPLCTPLLLKCTPPGGNCTPHRPFVKWYNWDQITKAPQWLFWDHCGACFY